MNESTFWVLIKNFPEKPLTGPVMQLDPVSILEINEDGAAFIWPTDPDREDRCQYCAKSRGVPEEMLSSKVFQAAHCLPFASSPYPCRFIKAEDADHQDLDDYLLNGACKDAGGYFLGLKQFLEGHGYFEEELSIISLGPHNDIAVARDAWRGEFE